MNPGLIWMWTSEIRSLETIGVDSWVSADERDQYATDDAGQCLSLAYDKPNRRYALQVP